MIQYSLSFIDPREHLEKRLSDLTGLRVKLTLTKNRSTYFMCQSRYGNLDIRLHRIFANAGEEVIKSVAQLSMRRTRKASKIVSHFFETAAFTADDIAHKNIKYVSRGKYFDLSDIFNRLNSEYFNNSIEAKITWGKSIKKKRIRNIHLGAYDYHSKKITIHPNLDREYIPEYVVEATVHHEMCHQAAGSHTTQTGQRRHHTPEFRNLEKAFSKYEQAKEWERKHLNLLLRG